MSDQPLVACIMLVNGRPEMVKRAVQCFRSQTYPRTVLHVLDSGDPPAAPAPEQSIMVTRCPDSGHESIGKLRNMAIALVPNADIIAHWDSDDWSHPNRLEEQVLILERTHRELVGYREMIFWDSRPGQFCGAWVYTSEQTDYCLGTSLTYWRSGWDKLPFPDSPKRGANQIGEGEAEELAWQARFKRCSITSIREDEEPRMIASIHGGNTLARITPGMNCWRRAPEFDAYCAERMNL